MTNTMDKSPVLLKDPNWRNKSFINAVYFINLDRCPHRYWAVMASLHAAWVPYEIIERFPAKDGRNYETIHDVAADMVKDGFSSFSHYLNRESYWHQPKNMCVQWSHLSVLRMIVERNETALVFEDDCYLRMPFWDLDVICSQLPNLEVLYLAHFSWSEVDSDPTKDEWMALESKFIKELKPTQFPHVYANSYGMGAWARVWTPHGAERFLSEHLKRPWAGSENVGWEMKRDGLSVENHYIYQYNNLDRVAFVFHDSRFDL